MRSQTLAYLKIYISNFLFIIYSIILLYKLSLPSFSLNVMIQKNVFLIVNIEVTPLIVKMINCKINICLFVKKKCRWFLAIQKSRINHLSVSWYIRETLKYTCINMQQIKYLWQNIPISPKDVVTKTTYYC